MTACLSRTLTSAWIETVVAGLVPRWMNVALSRVRGLKLPLRQLIDVKVKSHSHECVD